MFRLGGRLAYQPMGQLVQQALLVRRVRRELASPPLLAMIYIRISVRFLVQGSSSLTTISGAGRSSKHSELIHRSALGLQLLYPTLSSSLWLVLILQIIDGIEMMLVDNDGSEVGPYVKVKGRCVLSLVSETINWSGDQAISMINLGK